LFLCDTETFKTMLGRRCIRDAFKILNAARLTAAGSAKINVLIRSCQVWRENCSCFTERTSANIISNPILDSQLNILIRIYSRVCFFTSSYLHYDYVRLNCNID